MGNVKLSEEYIEENVFNSLWRVHKGISTVKKESKYLTKKMLEVRKLLIESHLPHVIPPLLPCGNDNCKNIHENRYRGCDLCPLKKQ